MVGGGEEGVWEGEAQRGPVMNFSSTAVGFVLGLGPGVTRRQSIGEQKARASVHPESEKGLPVGHHM